MTDIINLNSIRSDNCDCNKPKKQPCGCHNHNPQPCHQAIDLGDLYFKVKNLFSELKSEWQRTEARSNLGITDIIDLRLTKESLLSGGLNEWTMTTSKGGVEKKYTLYVRNGQQGESATIEIVSLDCELAPDATPVVRNLGTESHAQYMIKLPKGKQGEDGAPGESAFAIANRVRRSLHLDPFETEEAWLASLKGPQGEPGTSGKDGKDGEDGNSIESVELVDYGPYTKTFLNNLQLSAKMFIWRVTWKSGKTADIWVPENVGGGSVVPVGTPTFLYKLITFSTKPQDSDFRRTLDNLYAEVNKDSSGRTVEYLIENKNWRKTAPVISQPGYEFIYMATSVITEDNVGLWSVVQLTGALGEEGPEGPQGPAGPGGSSGQGLIGPVIRMRGSWSSGNCYVNLSNLAQNGTELRFIDIVVHNGEYWMVSPGIVGCAEGAPSNSNTNWIKAVEFDFAYINTLIADYIKNYTIDTSEIRIHKVDNWNNPTDDEIVAGMTSGKSVSDWEINNNNTGDPIRIWAGTNVDILDNSGNNVSYTLNLENAKFKVRLSGKLEATDADIEGTILANTLRLGDGSFLSGTDNLRSKVLPKLQNNKILMFYLLTDEMRSGVFTLSPSNGDKIQYLDVSSGNIVTSSASVSLKPKKLYQLFGIDHDLNSTATTHNLIWHLVELNLASVEVTATTVDGGIVPSDCYSVSYYIIIQDIVNNQNTGDTTGTLKPLGTIYLSVENNYIADITVHIATVPFEVSFGDPGKYTMEISCNGIVVTKDNKNYTHTFSYDYQNQSDGLITVNFSNEDLAGLSISAVSSAPTITINSVDLNTTTSPFMERDTSYTEQGKYKFLFKNTLISATY